MRNLILFLACNLIINVSFAETEVSNSTIFGIQSSHGEEQGIRVQNIVVTPDYFNNFQQEDLKNDFIVVELYFQDGELKSPFMNRGNYRLLDDNHPYAVISVTVGPDNFNASENNFTIGGDIILKIKSGYMNVSHKIVNGKFVEAGVVQEVRFGENSEVPVRIKSISLLTVDRNPLTIETLSNQLGSYFKAAFYP